MEEKIMFELPKIETIELECEKENLLDYMWLFNNIPWENHDNKNAKIIFKEPIEMIAIEMNGYDTHTSKIKRFYFDSVIINAFHGTANHYTFQFYLKTERVHITGDERSFGYSLDETKKRFIEKLESKIRGLKYQMKYAEDAIEIINKF